MENTEPNVQEQMEERKKRFLSICEEKIKRTGINDLICWLANNSDFFTAPASTRFHGNYMGGLCEHSLNVYDALNKLLSVFPMEGITEETVAISALFHDLCKTNFYVPGTRNVKNETTGKWEKVDCYKIEDQLPLGHGEKSVIMLQNFIRLKQEELFAIRWHMNGFDCATKGGDPGCSQAYGKCPFAALLALADQAASYLMEKTI